MKNIRYLPLLLLIASVPVGLVLALSHPFVGGLLAGVGLLGSAVGLYDLYQSHHAVLKNYPVIARLRFLFEGIRPEIRQYFLESDHEEVPLFQRTALAGLQKIKIHRRTPPVWHSPERTTDWPRMDKSFHGTGQSG